MIDGLAEEILNFLLNRGGFAEHHDMPGRKLPEFGEAIKYLVRNEMLIVRVSGFDGLTTYRVRA